MPILDAEPDVNPPDLFASVGDGRQWWLAHTRPRQEKATARQLYLGPLPFYIPCLPRRTKVGQRLVTARIPLFPGYVFVRATAAEKWRILATNRVADLICVGEQDRLWDDLRRVRRVLDLGVPVAPETALEVGTPVKIRDGPLTGMTGTVLKSAGGFKFVVTVDFIHRGLSVTVDGGMIGRMDADSA